MDSHTTVKWSFSAILCLALLGACRADHRPAHPLDGEWAIRMWLDSAGAMAPASRGPIDGKLVIGGGISDLYNDQEDGWKPDFAYRIGRFYVDLEPFFHTPEPGPHRATFDTTRLASRDMSEEMVVRVDSPGIFRADVTPHLTHSGRRLRGLQTGDTIRGAWDGFPGGDRGPRGRFVMTRSPRSAFSDSAEARSRAAERAWREWEPPAIGPEDIVDSLPVEAAPR
jgi:hypothetical protein